MVHVCSYSRCSGRNLVAPPPTQTTDLFLALMHFLVWLSDGPRPVFTGCRYEVSVVATLSTIALSFLFHPAPIVLVSCFSVPLSFMDQGHPRPFLMPIPLLCYFNLADFGPSCSSSDSGRLSVGPFPSSVQAPSEPFQVLYFTRCLRRHHTSRTAVPSLFSPLPFPKLWLDLISQKEAKAAVSISLLGRSKVLTVR